MEKNPKKVLIGTLTVTSILGLGMVMPNLSVSKTGCVSLNNNFKVYANKNSLALAQNKLSEKQILAGNNKFADKVSPTQPIITIDNNILTITAGTDTESGVKETKYQFNDGTWINYTGPVKLGDGIYTINAKTIDNAGNISSIATKSVVVDTEAPILNLTANTTKLTNKDVIITATATDSGSGVKSITMPDNTVVNKDSASYTITSNGTYEFKATDKVGHVATKSISIGNIDKTLPSSPTINMNSNQLTITDGIDEESGVSETDYQINNEVWTKYTAPVTLADGSYTINAKTIDNAGNVSSINTKSITVDTTKPTLILTASTTNLTNRNVVITAAAEDKGSGIASITAPDNFVVNNTSTTYTVSTNGTYTFKASDRAGNITIKSITISNIDKTAPDTPILTASKTNPTNTPVTVTIIYPKDAETKQYKIGTSGKYQNYTNPVVLKSSDTIYAKCQDAAGNWSEESSIVINNIDTTAPTAPTINVNDSKLTITSGTDKESGVSETDYQLNDGAWTKYTSPVTLSSGSYTINAKTIDNAGNVSLSTLKVIVAIKATGISLNKTADELEVKGTDTLTAVVTPENSTNKAVKWTSSDSSIASVDNSGKVTAIAAGTAVITATLEDGSLSASCTINVQAKTSKLIINLTNGTSKQYRISEVELNKFLKWFNARANYGTSLSYYTFKIPATTSSPAKTEYVYFNTIAGFDVE